MATGSSDAGLWAFSGEGELRREVIMIMHKALSAFAASALCLTALPVAAQVMSGSSRENPTNGYASSATANKDKSTHPTKMNSHKKTQTARTRATGTSPAETAGASSPNGPCPINPRGEAALKPGCLEAPSP